MPPTTGGSTTGSTTIARSTALPGIADRARIHASGTPSSNDKAVAGDRHDDREPERRARRPPRGTTTPARPTEPGPAARSPAGRRRRRRSPARIHRGSGVRDRMDQPIGSEPVLLERRLPVGAESRKSTNADARSAFGAPRDHGDRVGRDHVDVVGDLDRGDVVAGGRRDVGLVHDAGVALAR